MRNEHVSPKGEFVIMVFLDDLKDKLDISGFSDCKIIIFDNGAYVEGHSGVTDFSGGSVVFKLKKKRLRLEGGDFRLSCISKDAASVRGKIEAVFFEDIERKEKKGRGADGKAAGGKT
ncbi:MAG: hypothetical protein LBQ40_04845 [Clostridiales bacterium]|jgi:sporulation protein YqfC|nr:hypothetical protein [Clostridiales bacterium]